MKLLIKQFLLSVSIILNTSEVFAQPIISSFSPASGSAGTLVTIVGNNLNNVNAITIGGVAALVISNTETVLNAMVMPGSITGLVTVTTSIGTTNSNSQFSITSNGVPNVQQGNKLVGSGSTGISQQAYSLALSADGSTAIVGAKGDNNDQGAAWIFVRTGTTWSQQGNKLVGTGSIGEAAQGVSVAISADGNTAIVGGNLDNNGIGAAWIFVRNGITWSQQGNKLVGSGFTGSSNQGFSVSISANGNTAIIGGSKDDSNIGAVWVFTKTGITWGQLGNKLVGTGFIGESYQGYSTGISADGNTIIVGGQFDNYGQGAAWIFARTGNLWTQQGVKLVGTGASSAIQGCSVSLSADGNTAIVGGQFDYPSGAAWVFTRIGNTWSQQGTKLVGTNAIGSSQQGQCARLSADGNTAIIGGYKDNSHTGAAWIFKRSGTNWSQQGNKLIGTGISGISQQGWSVAISADGKTILVGGNQDNSIGATWVFISPPVLPVTFTSIKAYEKNKGIQVDWQVTHQINLQEYEVEKSENGIHFKTIETLAANNAGSYSFFDEKCLNNNFYRIKAIDQDGTISYSKIVQLKKNGNISGSIKLHYNPLSLKFENMKTGNYDLSIYNMLGQKLSQQTISYDGGALLQEITIDMKGKGLCLLHVTNKHNKFSETILIQ